MLKTISGNSSLLKISAIVFLVFFANNLFSQKDKYQDDKNFIVSHFSQDELKWYHFLSAKKYDSVIHLCSGKTYPFNEELIALAEAYESLGIKDSAYHYVNRKLAKDIDEGRNPYNTITNCLITPNLCKNPEIASFIEQRYQAFYANEGHREWKAGLEILKLAYLDQKIRYQHALKASECQDEECLDEVNKIWKDTDNKIRDRLLELWQEKGGYISEREGGPWASKQWIIVLHMADTLLRQRVVLPVLKKAYEEGELGAVGYVEQIVRTEFYRRGGIYDEYLDNYADSLCKEYNCGIKREFFPQIFKH